MGLLHEAEVAGPHFLAIRGGKAEDGPVLSVGDLAVFQLPYVA